MSFTPERNLPPVIAVVGPTASGKTALAIALAKRLGGEIISCDSMQIYRGMDIGTAKPTKEELAAAPHHMIDVADPEKDFSAADYASMALPIVYDILSRGKLPIFCGGTGLYLDAVLNGGSYTDESAADTKPDESLRASLLADAERYGAEDLWKRLSAVDPESAATIHPNNIKRVARALEIYLSTGRTKTENDRISRERTKPRFSYALLMPSRPRDELYKRIDMRVDMMFADGLGDEIKRLLAGGKLVRGTTASQAIGYKEVLDALDAGLPPESASDAIKLASRRYAKRQITWFSRKDHLFPVDMCPADLPDGADDSAKFEVIVNNALKLLTFDAFCDIIKE